MNFNVSLNDELSLEIVAQAAKSNLTPTHYLEILINSIYAPNEVYTFDYISALHTVIDQAETVAKTQESGYRFALNQLPYFKELNNTLVLNNKTVPSAIKARIGLNFNKAVSNGSVYGIKRACMSDGTLLFSAKSALYEVL